MIDQTQLDSTRKLSILIAEIEARNEQTSQQHQQAMETLCLAIRDMQQLAGRIPKQTLEEFRRSAGIALKDGLKESLTQARNDIDNAIRDVRGTAEDLRREIDSTGRAHKLSAWKAFIASSAGSIAIMSATAYAVMTARTELTRAAWTRQINAAIVSGHLAPCQTEGICARIDGKRWVRIDAPAPSAK